MAHTHDLPTLDDLTRLAQPQEHAITVYVPSSPVVSERDLAFATAKSALDAAIGQLREEGARHNTQEAVRTQWEEIAADAEVWGGLSRSLAIFVTPEWHDVYVLPNRLESQSQVSTYFDLGQLVRAAASEQHAYALTLSANEWSLWEATATDRADELELAGDHPEDAGDATNRKGIRGRQHVGRLVGDEGKKVLLEKYAARVAEAVDAELLRVDPSSKSPLFVFANEPLLSMYSSAEQRREVVAVPGAPDELRPDEIDAVVRERLPELAAAQVSAQLERMGNDVSRGLVATELAEIARAAATGAVDALVYEFTVDILGSFDETTGEIVLAGADEGGYDLLSRIAVTVHRSGGDVIPVRADEVAGGVWNGVAVAHLRYAV